MFDKNLEKEMLAFESEKEKQEIISELNDLYRLSNAGNRREDFNYIKGLAVNGSIKSYFEPKLNDLKDKLKNYFNDNQNFNIIGFFKEYNYYENEGFTENLIAEVSPGQQIKTWFHHFIYGNLSNLYHSLENSSDFEEYKQRQNGFSSEEIRNNLLLMQANFRLLDDESKELICFNELIGGKLEELENILFNTPIPKEFDEILRVEQQIKRASIICNGTLPEDFSDRMTNISKVTSILKTINSSEYITDQNERIDELERIIGILEENEEADFSKIIDYLNENINNERLLLARREARDNKKIEVTSNWNKRLSSLSSRRPN